jgi:hypothetical protein
MLRTVMNFRASSVTLGLLLFASASFSVAHADEHASGIQTELADTTISGYADASADIGVGAPSDFSASFSVSSVPEPSSVDLIAVGSLAFGLFGMARHRRAIR